MKANGDGTDESIKEITDLWNQESTKGLTITCLWRPTNMDGPCYFKPLAVCDPNTVPLSDFVPSSMHGFTASGLPAL